MITPAQLEIMNSNLPPVARTMNARVVAGDKVKGRIEMRFTMREDFCHAQGLQGGLVAAMLDNTMARVSHLISDGKLSPATLEMKVSYFRPGSAGVYRGEGQLVSRSRKIIFLQASLFDKTDQLVAKSTSTAKLIPSSESSTIKK